MAVDVTKSYESIVYSVFCETNICFHDFSFAQIYYTCTPHFQAGKQARMNKQRNIKVFQLCTLIFSVAYVRVKI